MQAVIDIGDQKTGSKARQVFLKKNESEFIKHGCCCLKATKVGAYDMGLSAYAGVEKHIDTFCYKHGLEATVDFDYFLEKQIESELSKKGCSRVFFSFEGLMHLSPDKIEKLTSMLYRHFSEILIVGFVRRQDRMAVSGYSTRLRAGGATGYDILYNLRGGVKGTNYYKRFKNWSEHIPAQNIIFINYDECSDVSQAFVGVANIPGALKFDDTRKNTSLSMLGAEILRRFNQDLASQEDYKAEAGKIRGVIKGYYSGEPLRPSKSEAKESFEAFSESNKKLAQLFGSSRKYFFDESFSEYPDEFAPLELSLSEVKAYVQKALMSS